MDWWLFLLVPVALLVPMLIVRPTGIFKGTSL